MERQQPPIENAGNDEKWANRFWDAYHKTMDTGMRLATIFFLGVAAYGAKVEVERALEGEFGEITPIEESIFAPLNRVALENGQGHIDAGWVDAAWIVTAAGALAVAGAAELCRRELKIMAVKVASK